MERKGHKDYFATYGLKSAPKKGQKGFREPQLPLPGAWDGAPPHDIARCVLSEALRMMEDPGFYSLVKHAETGDDCWVAYSEGGFSGDDLPDVLGIPVNGPDGKEMSFANRRDMALDVVAYAMEVDPMRWGGHTFPERVEGFRGHRFPERSEGFCNEGVMPFELLAMTFGDFLWSEAIEAKGGRPLMRLVPLSSTAAWDFIRKHHSVGFGRQPPGIMYAIGVDYGGRLVAVATAGTPTAKWAEHGRYLELTRIASDGTIKDAASYLAARMASLVPFSGRSADKPILVTYQLVTEKGTTYKALADMGFRPVKYIRARKKPGGARSKGRGLMSDIPKIAWMCCDPDHLPFADWSLLDMTVKDIKDFVPGRWLKKRERAMAHVIKAGHDEVVAKDFARGLRVKDIDAVLKMTVAEITVMLDC